MEILKLMPIDNEVYIIIGSTVSREVHSWITMGYIDEDIWIAFSNTYNDILVDYKTMGCHFIGKWKYITEISKYDTDGVEEIVRRKITKYRPYLQVLNQEFAKVEEKEKRDYTNSAHGTTRGAIEDSPITSAPITSAPDDSTEWNLNNPTLKNGSQFDNEYERNEQVLNPEWQLRLLKFNVGELNLTRIAEMFVKSLIEEYNTVY